MTKPTRSRARRAAVLLTFILALFAVAYFAVSAVILDMALVGKRRVAERTPADDGLSAEPLRFSSAADQVPLNGWFLKGSGDRAVVVLHGIDSHGWNNYSRVLAKALLERGISVLVFDLRGQGSSGGEQLGLGWLERQDVRGAVDLLLQRGFAPGSIGLNGSSYGAATSLLSAAMIPEVAAVVADSPFADIRDLMGAELKQRVGSPRLFEPGIVLAGRWWFDLDLASISPLQAVPQIAPRPIFLTHGDQDKRIPVDHSRRLKAVARGPEDQLWIVPGAGHTQAYKVQPDEYFSRVVAFFDRHLRSSTLAR